MSRSFERMASKSAEIKRPAKIVGGKRGAPETAISGLKCTPLTSLTDEEQARLGIPQASALLLETYLVGEVDIRVGDILATGGREYPIKSVKMDEWGGETLIRLVLEKVVE